MSYLFCIPLFFIKNINDNFIPPYNDYLPSNFTSCSLITCEVLSEQYELVTSLVEHTCFQTICVSMVTKPFFRYPFIKCELIQSKAMTQYHLDFNFQYFVGSEISKDMETECWSCFLYRKL